MPLSQHMAPDRSRTDPAAATRGTVKTLDFDHGAAFDSANPWRDAALLLIRQARRHVWLILASALACGFLAGVAKTVLPVKYKASAQILIDPQENRAYGVDTPGTTLEASAAINFVESQMGVIGSERVLLRVIRDEGLAGAPPAAGEKPGQESQGQAGQGQAAQESEDSRRAGELAENKALVVLQKAVKIQRAERSFLIDLTVTDKSPEKAARLANALVKAYGDVNQTDRNAAARALSGELANRIVDMRRLLGESETRLLNFKTEHNLVGLHDKSITDRLTTEATDALSAAENREAQARARLKQLESAPAGVGGVAAFGPDPKSRQLQVLIDGRAAARADFEQLESTLGDRHPALAAARARLRDFDRRIVQSVEGLRHSARAQVSEAHGQTVALTKKLADLAGEMSRARESDVALQQLEDAVEVKRKALTALETRQRDANDMSHVEGVNFRLVSPARVPNSHGKTIGAVLWSLCGGLIGAALALASLAVATLFEEGGSEPGKIPASQPSIQKESPASGDPCLGALPAITPAAGRRLSPFEAMNEVARRPDSPYSQAVAAVLGRLDRARSDGGGPVVVLVAATAAQAGASTLAANLARTAAGQGARTLLIDAQARPVLDLMITADAPKTLIELAGRRRPLYRLAPFSHDLSLIPALANEERICRSIAEHSAYERIAGVKGNFDFVVIDGPDAGDLPALRSLVPAAGLVLLVALDEEEADLPRLLRRLGVAPKQFAGYVRAASPRLSQAA